MKRIALVVDDRMSNREYLAALLGARGFHVHQATGGAEALEIARQMQPTVVITDILMPAMDGYEFVRRLHAEPGLERIPVVFISGQYAVGAAW